MHLQKLRIQNFKSIRDIEIRDIENALILVGKNNAGKTVILDALRILNDTYDIQETDFNLDGANIEIDAEFLLDENAEAVRDLREMDIDSEGEIVLSRRFSESGKNSVKISPHTGNRHFAMVYNRYPQARLYSRSCIKTAKP